MSDSEERLTDQLREIFDATDPPPRHLVDLAKASLSWRTADAELAELAADSSTEPALAMRAAAPPRLLTFISAAATVVVEVTRHETGRSLFGQLIAPGLAQIELRHTGGVISLATDDDGRFRTDGVAAGPFSLRCRFAESARAAVVTSWVTI